MTPNPTERSRALDGLRGLAIALVVLYHLNLAGIGWVGVQLFFVLSGFLITRLLLELREGQTLLPYLRTFHGRRALRIFPLYFVYLLGLLALGGLLPAGQQAAVAAQWPFAASYTSNWSGMTAGHQPTWWLDHLWSLAIEEQFYLLWPLLLFALPRRHLPAALLALVLAGPLLRGATALLWPRTGLADAANLPQAVALCTFSQLDAFATGGLLCVTGPWPWRLPRPGVLLLALGLLAWLAGALVNGAGLLPMRPQGAFLTLGYPNTLPVQGQWLWGYSALNLLSALLIAAVLQQGLGRALFEHPALVRLGQLSYGIYLLHFPLAHLTSPAVYRLHELTGANLYVCLLLFAPMYLSLLLGLAMFSHTLLETPLLRLKERWFPRPSAQR